MTSLLHRCAVAICLSLLLAACQPIESVPPVEVLPAATSAATSAPGAAPTSTNEAPTLVDHIVLDEGFSIAIPEGWAAIELDNRRLEENVEALKPQDATRAEYENDMGRYLIDHSIPFYAYELANQIDGSRRAEVVVTTSQLTQDDIQAFVKQLESMEGIILPVGVRTIQTRSGLEMTEISYSSEPVEGDAFERAESRRYILDGENEDYLITVNAIVTDEEEPFVPFEMIAESFDLVHDERDSSQTSASSVIVTNGLVTDTLPGGKTIYTSTAMDLP